MTPTAATHTTFAVDGLLFDCDGVLVHSADAAAHAVEQLGTAVTWLRLSP